MWLKGDREASTVIGVLNGDGDAFKRFGKALNTQRLIARELSWNICVTTLGGHHTLSSYIEPCLI